MKVTFFSIESVKSQLLKQMKLRSKPDLKLDFSNPIGVFPHDPVYRNKHRGPDEEMRLGDAFLSVEDGKLVGDIKLLPYLDEFYEKHASYRPNFIAINALATNGDQVESIVFSHLEIVWNGAKQS